MRSHELSVFYVYGNVCVILPDCLNTATGKIEDESRRISGYYVGMTGKIDVRALASLARLEVSDEELAKLEKEIPDILKFVETIQKVAGKEISPSSGLINVMRADNPPAGGPHEGGKYTEALLKAAPASVDNRIAVKQVISRKK